MVHELMDGTIKIKYESEELPYSVLKLIKEKQDDRDEQHSSSWTARVHLGMASTAKLRNSTVYRI